MATVVKTMGRWEYEQLPPIELCGLHADLGRLLGGSLRAALLRLLYVLGAADRPGEQLAARGARVMAALEAKDGDRLAEFARGLLDRPWDDLVADLDVLSLGVAELARAADGRAVKSLMLDVLVYRDDRPRGGLRFQVAPGARQFAPIATRDELDAQFANEPTSLWRVFTWALLVNLHPLLAALSTSLARPTPASPSPASGPTPATPGPSSS